MGTSSEAGFRAAWFPGSAFDVVGLAASAGGLAALSSVLGGLPGDFPAAVLVVQHLAPDRPSLLVPILAARTLLRIKSAEDGEMLRTGVIYVAPPDRHLRTRQVGRLDLDAGAAVHHVRPSADVLFASLAESYGPRAIAVVLSGTGSDGASGAVALQRAGGIVLAQDEASSTFFGMPAAAIDAGCVKYVLALRDIAPAIVRLVATADTGGLA